MICLFYPTITRYKKMIRMSVLLFAVTSATTCGGGGTGPDTIWNISVEPNRANATSGSAPGNEVDFTVSAHYTSGRRAPWTGDVEWSTDAGWVNLQNGRAICVGPAPPWFPLNIPTPANINARVTTEGKTFSGPASLACF